jgi:hypothetical protein
VLNVLATRVVGSLLGHLMATLCEQTAAFSEQLGEWARGLQSDCKETAAMMEPGSAIAGGRELVSSMEADVENLGASVRLLRDDTFGDGTLASALAAALQFQSDSEAQLELVEQYLQQQHGYVPGVRERMDTSVDAGGVAASTTATAALDDDYQATLSTSTEEEEQKEAVQLEEEEEEETEHEEAVTCSIAEADALMAEDSPTPSLDSLQPGSPDCTARDPDMPRTPRLEDFGLGDLAAKYGLAMDKETSPQDAGEEVNAAEDAQSEKLGATTRSLSEARSGRPGSASNLPVGTPKFLSKSQAFADFQPRQSPRLAAKLKAGSAHQSPMEKVLARASSPSPLKVLNRTDSHGLTNLKARLSAATQGRVTAE